MHAKQQDRNFEHSEGCTEDVVSVRHTMLEYYEVSLFCGVGKKLSVHLLA